MPAFMAFKPVQVLRKAGADAKALAKVKEEKALAFPEAALEKAPEKAEKAPEKAEKAPETVPMAEPSKEAPKEKTKQKEKAKASGEASPTGGPGARKKLDIGDVDEFRKQLAQQRDQLRLWIIKAKQEWEEKQSGAGHRGETNDQEYYIASIGETLGRGVFSSVFRCKHVTQKTDYALKFVRANKMMRKAAEKEVETYRKLAKLAAKEDQEGAQYIMLLSPPETFEHQGHLTLRRI
eukprot:g15549.t1